MADRVKQVALEEADKVKSMTHEAVKSQAYLYPLKVSSFQLQMPLILIASRASITSSRTRIYGDLSPQSWRRL